MAKILALLFLSFFILIFPFFFLSSELRQDFSYRFFPIVNELETSKFVKSILESEGNFLNDQNAFFDNKKVAPLQTDFIAQTTDNVLGETKEEKWIEVDLSEQKLYAWQGNQKIFEFTISSGKPWTPTVEGEYRIWIKLRYHTMEGGSKVRGDYYRLPNVPYVMYFYRGYGIHGTYWHNNFGRPMSHGCINLKIPDAQKLFYWAQPQLPSGRSVVLANKDNPGTRVVIHQ